MPGFVYGITAPNMHNNVRTPRGQDTRPPAQSPPRDYYAYHDPEGSATFSTTVIHALADVMGLDVTDSKFVLYDSVDPGALDRIFARTEDGAPRSPGHVAFSVDDYRVTVYSDGRIVITPPTTPHR